MALWKWLVLTAIVVGVATWFSTSQYYKKQMASVPPSGGAGTGTTGGR